MPVLWGDLLLIGLVDIRNLDDPINFAELTSILSSFFRSKTSNLDGLLVDFFRMFCGMIMQQTERRVS